MSPSLENNGGEVLIKMYKQKYVHAKTITFLLLPRRELAYGT